MREHAPGLPGFRAAYTAGSTNWLPDEAGLGAASDLDIMAVLAGSGPHCPRSKFLYRGVLLEVSRLSLERFRSPGEVLADYHLAPSLHAAKVVFDPSGHLSALRAILARLYADAGWIRRRCEAARAKSLEFLRSAASSAALDDRVMACLFGAGVTTHVLLAAGLKNPTVRTRYEAARQLLAEHRAVEHHETLLRLLGSACIGPDRARGYVAALAPAFDAASAVLCTPFSFASDISETARAVALGGAIEQIDRGSHREAMFWVAVTWCRVRKILSADAPERWDPGFDESYRALLDDLGLLTGEDVRRRRGEIESALPQITAIAEEIIAASAIASGASKNTGPCPPSGTARSAERGSARDTSTPIANG